MKQNNEPGHIVVSSAVLTPKNRALMTVHVDKTWMTDNHMDNEQIITASQNAFCCSVSNPRALMCYECCGTSGQVHAVKVSPLGNTGPSPEPENDSSLKFSFQARSVCTSSWKHMGAKQVRLCVELSPTTVLFSNPISLYARLRRRKKGVLQRKPKNSEVTAMQSFIPALSSPPFGHGVMLPAGLFVVVWITQISSLVTQELAMANVICGMKSRPTDELVGHSVQRLWPDPGNHPLVKPVTRWSVMVYSYTSQQEAVKSISDIRSFNQNRIRNLFNLDMEAAGLINIVAAVNNW